MVYRKYQWKIQIRVDKDSQWKDDEIPKEVDIPNYKTNQMERVSNSFRLDLDDGKPIPEQYYAILGGRPIMTHEVRTVLESVDAGGNRTTFELKFFEKVDPRKKLIPPEGIAYLICKIDDCGKKVAPSREPQHLIEFHNKRFKYIKEIDHTHQKYFEVHLIHGKTVVEVKHLDEEPKLDH